MSVAMTAAVHYSVLGFLALSCYASSYVKSGLSGSDGGAPRFEPQVAMVCGSRSQYVAQYMTESGRWVTDSTSKVTCLKDKSEILNFCKQVYPNRDITNIVESSHFYKVQNFCRVGHSKCKASVWVKPYRCLEGSFQSDALLVPEGCLFDHIHNQSRCLNYDTWNSTADKSCQGREMVLKAFAMLLPCGIDLFSGVEFVCCPESHKGNTPQDMAKDLEEPRALPQVDRRAYDSESSSAKQHADSTTPAEEVGTRDEYFSKFDPHEEHDAFRRAETRLEERHRNKVSKIMKEWSELEERYQDLRDKDPRGAEEFKHRMTQRFQQTVEAVEAENEAEKHQLTALHQQRIVAHINEMKRESMTCYTRALEEPRPNTHKVQKCLQKLLRSLNKDRHHTVSHFKHLLNSDYEAADRERDSTLQHLSDLERMINQSLSMLSRHPDLYAKIGRLMHEYAAALRSKDSTPPELSAHFLKDNYSTEETSTSKEHDDDDETVVEAGETDEEDDSKDDDGEEYDTVAELSADDNDTAAEDDDDDNDDDDSDDDEDDKDNKEVTADNHNTEDSRDGDHKDGDHPSAFSVDSPSNTPIDPLPPSPPASIAPDADSAHVMEDPHIAHAQHNRLSHSQSGFSVTREVPASESRGVYFTLAFAGIALMVAMVVGIVVLRRRNSRHPHNQGFIEVDQAATPEERHVTNMQVNGYENPTYKYFEEK